MQLFNSYQLAYKSYFISNKNIWHQLFNQDNLNLITMDCLQTEEEKTIIIKIDFEEEEIQHQIQLKEGDQIYTLLNYDKIRKKILQTYKYMASVKNQIQLTITNFYRRGTISIPIHHPKNYTFLVNDMITRGINIICIRVHRLKELTKRKQRQKQAPIQFDSDGSVQSVENQAVENYVNTNRPKCKPYQNKQIIVRCLFCHVSSRQGNQSKIAGPLYGPFDKTSYAHLLCLLWCSDVFLDQDFNLRGVTQAIKHTKKIQCNYCHQKGASFYCHTKSCRKGGHYKCALRNNWLFNWTNYTTYCPQCTNLYDYKIFKIKQLAIQMKAYPKEKTMNYEVIKEKY